MKARIESLIDEIIAEDGLPSSVLERATAFIRDGELRLLTELPLSPDEMIQVGTVLLRAPASERSSAYGEPRPVLAPPLRRRLRALVDEGGAHAEAALFVLGQDLKARAFNRALAARP